MSLSREQKIEKARELRAAGWKYRQIADRLGISTSTAYAWVNPERVAPYRNGRAIDPKRTRAYDREYSRTHRAACPQCGGEMSRTTERSGGKCAACHADDLDRRRRQIEGWWSAGLPMPEIAANLGWQRSHLSVEMHRMREQGYSLPYRRAVHNTADGKPRFPEQVAA
jgi:transposase